MAVVDAKGIKGKHLSLGIQGYIVLEDEIEKKVRAWAPPKARSYTVFNFRFVDYHRRPSLIPTSYALFDVEFYSRADEGTDRL